MWVTNQNYLIVSKFQSLQTWTSNHKFNNHNLQKKHCACKNHDLQVEAPFYPKKRSISFLLGSLVLAQMCCTWPIFWSKSASVSTWNDLWTTKNNRKFSTSVDGSEIRRSPVEVGSFIPLCTGFFYIPGGAGFLPSIVSKIMTMWCGMMWLKKMFFVDLISHVIHFDSSSYVRWWFVLTFRPQKIHLLF